MAPPHPDMAAFTEKLEFPFLPDEAEHLIISLTERRSVLLIGRSGTGKTTIVVQRMWLKFQASFQQALTECAANGAADGLEGADEGAIGGLAGGEDGVIEGLAE
eukprot:4060673-Prymnesium_polylepis.1